MPSSFLPSYFDWQGNSTRHGTSDVWGCMAVKLVRRFESGCLRKTVKIRWYDIVSGEELKRLTEQQSVTEKNKNKPMEVAWAPPEKVE